jgi:hypothetical protein
MASFTEQATLKVNDQSSSAIRRINADLAACVSWPVNSLALPQRSGPHRRNAPLSARRCGRRRLYGVHHTLISSAP